MNNTVVKTNNGTEVKRHPCRPGEVLTQTDKSQQPCNQRVASFLVFPLDGLAINSPFARTSEECGAVREEKNPKDLKL